MDLVDARGRAGVYDEARSPPQSLIDPWDVSKSSVRRTFHLQAAIAALFLIAFLLYIPVGLAIIEPFERLTIKQVGASKRSCPLKLTTSMSWCLQCLDRDLGAEYCSGTMKYDNVDTKLWNYGKRRRRTGTSWTGRSEHDLGAH